MKTIAPLLVPGLALGFLQISSAQDDPRAAIAADNPHLHVRSGLPHLKQQLEVKRTCHVAFLGGSITQNTGGHTAMVPAWLKQKFPGVEVTVTNAGLGSTCSTSGAFRLESHIFGKGEVDLLVVEFAVNDDQDAGHARRECIRGMEGIINQVQSKHPKCGIVMVHYANPGMLDKLGKGEAPVAIAAHEAVAARHGVISVNVAAEVAAATKGGRYSWKDYGGTHPGRFGYRVASNMIIAALEDGLAKGQDASQAKPADLLDTGSYDHGRFLAPKEAKFPVGWRLGKVGRELLPLGGIRSQYSSYQLLRGEKPGARLAIEFTGRTVGAFLLAGPDAGILEASIDGGPATRHDLYHRYSRGLNYPRSVIFGTDLKPGKHVLALQLAEEKNPGSRGTTASILFFEVNR
jgi:lysophospholipase L1-like esterase